MPCKKIDVNYYGSLFTAIVSLFLIREAKVVFDINSSEVRVMTSSANDLLGVSLYSPRGTQSISNVSVRCVCVYVCGVCNLANFPLAHSHSCFTPPDYTLYRKTTAIIWAERLGSCDLISLSVVQSSQVSVFVSVSAFTATSALTTATTLLGHTDGLVTKSSLGVCTCYFAGVTLATVVMRNSLHGYTEKFLKVHIVLGHHNTSEKWAHCMLSNSRCRSS